MQNTETLTERAIISALLADPDAIAQMLDTGITVDHFEASEMRRIFETMLSRRAAGEWFGQVSLSTAMPDLSGIIHVLMTESYRGGVGFHAAILHRRLEKRQILLALSGLSAKIARTPDTEGLDLAGEFAEIIKSASDRDSGRVATISTTEAISRLDALVALRLAKDCGLPTGVTMLDSFLCGGLQSPQLYIIGARPGHGKTTLAIQIALKASRSVPVGFLTVEMTSDDLAASALSALSGVDSSQVRNGRVSLWTAELASAKENLKQLPIHIFESNGCFDRALTEMRRMVKRQACGLLIVDYLQILRAQGHGHTRLEELTYMSAALKCLAMELKVPIVACAQLNRAVEGRRDDEPRLSDLRESGSIEQDADVVLFLRRLTMESSKCAVNIHLAKNRRGQSGLIEASGDYATGRIWSI